MVLFWLAAIQKVKDINWSYFKGSGQIQVFFWSLPVFSYHDTNGEDF